MFNHLIFLSDSDDNEDIKVHRKPRHNAIKDSDSEEEEAAAKTSVLMAEAPGTDDSSGEEPREITGRAAKKGKRIGRAPADSEESESEQVDADMEEGQEEVREGISPTGKEKKREKSRRHREKEEKRSRVLEKLKKKERVSARNHVSGVKGFLTDLMFFLYLRTHTRPSVESESPCLCPKSLRKMMFKRLLSPCFRAHLLHWC